MSNAGNSNASSSSFDDPLQYCVSKPSLDFYRKGELPKENDWYKQYYNHSQKNLRDSYGTALNAKMKYRKQMIDLRGEETDRLGDSPRKAPSEIESDMESMVSVFRDKRYGLYQTRSGKNKGKSVLNKSESQPELSVTQKASLMYQEKIDALLATDKVRKACDGGKAFVKGMKYRYMGGGCHRFKGYEAHSIEDPVPWLKTLNADRVAYSDCPTNASDKGVKVHGTAEYYKPFPKGGGFP